MPEPKTKKKVRRKKKTLAKKKKVVKEKPLITEEMEKALEKIGESIEEEAEPEIAQSDSKAEGYKYGTTDEPLRVALDDPEYIRYQAEVRAKILRRWIVPPHLIGLPSDKKPRTQIVVLINQTGDVISKKFSQRSGFKELDSSAVRAVERASPLPVPPDRLQWEVFNEGFLVDFNPDQRY